MSNLHGKSQVVCNFCECWRPIQSMRCGKKHGYECRSDLGCFNRLLAKYRAMKRIGGQMSNVCWNLAQGRNLLPGDKERFDQLRKAWDEAR